MKIAHTRALITAALSGELSDVDYVRDPIFNIDVPMTVPGVPASVLQPRETWHSRGEYDAQARRLAEMFSENFQNFQDQVDEAVVQAGPKA